MDPVAQLWVYLETSPLAALTLTLVAYLAGDTIYRRSGRNPLLNPVLLAILLIAAVLLPTGGDYERYFEGAQFVHFLLGPATVALAIPLYKELANVRRALVPLAASLLVGSLTAAGTAVGLAWLAGASTETLASLAPKSVTTPVAMGVAESLGGLPSLTAAVVILTGIVGAALGPPVLDLARIRDPRARGLAMGTASHGIGTARALQMGQVAGAFAGIAIGLNALATAVLLPLLWRLVAG
ncbi:MAG: LrgB family protein [Alphaproteobacteria bacterium]|jgi:predicted murein hydrolase (TIGR00659 family)|nr:LrgB family protein [Alphaproteobacteria bacterium]